MSGTFWPTFLRFCSASSCEMIQGFLFRYFMGYSRVPARWKAAAMREALASIELEGVFTFLSERIRAPGTSSQLRFYANRVWSALVGEIGPVFRRFQPNSMTRKTYRNLLANHVRRWDTIVSFNYDTVFEHSLQQNGAWHYEGIEDEVNSLPILKPHRSSNWAERSPISLQDMPVLLS